MPPLSQLIIVIAQIPIITTVEKQSATTHAVWGSNHALVGSVLQRHGCIRLNLMIRAVNSLSSH